MRFLALTLFGGETEAQRSYNTIVEVTKAGKQYCRVRI